MTDVVTPVPNSAPALTTTVIPETSSPLTERFTETERARVQLLITSLPLIFEEAFKGLKEDASKTDAVDFWGVPIDPLRGAEDPRVSVILVKFLRARNLDVDAAQQMFIDTLRWRHTFRANETLNESFPEDTFGSILEIYGKDKGGRPVTYNTYAHTKDLPAVFGDLDRFLRWRVGKMEEALRKVDFLTIDSLTQVFDYAGLTMSSRDANAKKAATTATKLFADYYPETLHQKFFVNVPPWMAWVFWAFRAIVPRATFAKLQMVSSGPEAIGKALSATIDKSELPKQYGGDAEGFSPVLSG